MRPHNPRYQALPLPGAEEVDATLLYVFAGWPVLYSYARYLLAKENGRIPLVEATEADFLMMVTGGLRRHRPPATTVAVEI
jgi:hypothetical protein